MANIGEKIIFKQDKHITASTDMGISKHRMHHAHLISLQGMSHTLFQASMAHSASRHPRTLPFTSKPSLKQPGRMKLTLLL